MLLENVKQRFSGQEEDQECKMKKIYVSRISEEEKKKIQETAKLYSCDRTWPENSNTWLHSHREAAAEYISHV